MCRFSEYVWTVSEGWPCVLCSFSQDLHSTIVDKPVDSFFLHAPGSFRSCSVPLDEVSPRKPTETKNIRKLKRQLNPTTTRDILRQNRTEQKRIISASQNPHLIQPNQEPQHTHTLPNCVFSQCSSEIRPTMRFPDGSGVCSP